MQIQMQILLNFQVSSIISFSHTHNSFTEVSMTCIHINQFQVSVKFTKSLPSSCISQYVPLLNYSFSHLNNNRAQPRSKAFLLKAIRFCLRAQAEGPRTRMPRPSVLNSGAIYMQTSLAFASLILDMDQQVFFSDRILRRMVLASEIKKIEDKKK